MRARSGPLRFAAPVLLALLLLAMAVLALQPPAFESHAVVQIHGGAAAIHDLERRLTTRESLAATADRQGIAGDDPVVTLRRAVALHELTSAAGATLGLPPESSGVVVSVRLPDADLSARVANDLALQALDLGQEGQLDPGRDSLLFYRSEEDRLWQELSAMTSERVTGNPMKARQVMLVQDQYDAIRGALAQAEIAARLARQQTAGDFMLLARADLGVRVSGGAALLWALAALAFGVGLLALRQTSLPVRVLGALEGQVFGLPRKLALSVALIGLALGLTVSLH